MAGIEAADGHPCDASASSPFPAAPNDLQLALRRLGQGAILAQGPTRTPNWRFDKFQMAKREQHLAADDGHGPEADQRAASH